LYAEHEGELSENSLNIVSYSLFERHTVFITIQKYIIRSK
jgi:hypothetical protein